MEVSASSCFYQGEVHGFAPLRRREDETKPDIRGRFLQAIAASMKSDIEAEAASWSNTIDGKPLSFWLAFYAIVRSAELAAMAAGFTIPGWGVRTAIGARSEKLINVRWLVPRDGDLHDYGWALLLVFEFDGCEPWMFARAAARAPGDLPLAGPGEVCPDRWLQVGEDFDQLGPDHFLELAADQALEWGPGRCPLRPRPWVGPDGHLRAVAVGLAEDEIASPEPSAPPGSTEGAPAARQDLAALARAQEELCPSDNPELRKAWRALGQPPGFQPCDLERLIELVTDRNLAEAIHVVQMVRRCNFAEAKPTVDALDRSIQEELKAKAASSDSDRHKRQRDEALDAAEANARITVECSVCKFCVITSRDRALELGEKGCPDCQAPVVHVLQEAAVAPLEPPMAWRNAVGTSGYCEWNAAAGRPARIGDTAHATATLIVGAKDAFKLCEACSLLDVFKRKTKRVELPTPGGSR